ncbi:DnaJ domain-containing protein [Tanacetum coccineum]
MGHLNTISGCMGQLSDKSKRSAYDDRRNAAQNGGTPGQNGFYNFTKTTTTRNKGTSTTPKDRGTTSTAPPTSTNQKTFWTVCHACKMQYEYLRIRHKSQNASKVKGLGAGGDSSLSGGSVLQKQIIQASSAQAASHGTNGIMKSSKRSSGTVVNYQANTNEKEKLDDSVNVDLISTIEPLVMDVPDPDFHNFDRQRCETAFKEGQIWAAYDDDDGMPRHYAMIHKVSSVDPFKIKLCWLNSRTNDELNILSEKAFGEFKLGKHENVTVPNIFSHKVNFTKSENGCYEIYPRKGDVWALYRNWSPEWNDEISNEVKHNYEIVEVDESDEDTGFTVTPFVKVAGFKTVFRRNLNPKEARVFPESEICRFSHQIPSHFLAGRGSLNAIKGCLDLDPAAIPDEFLQVIAVVQDLENIDDDDDDDPIVKDDGVCP